MENGKQKTRVIRHLGPVKNDDDREMFEFEVMNERMKDTDMGKLDFDPPLEFGIVRAIRSVMERTGIFRSLSILEKFFFEAMKK
ncbi:MAG: hypothetical protein ACP5UO_00975 [Thermoplasmata archaeon]